MEEQKTLIEIEDGMIVPAPARIMPQRYDDVGCVPGLPDEEPADLDELEQQVMRDLSGPDLLPSGRQRRQGNQAYAFSAEMLWDRPQRQQREVMQQIREELRHIGILSQIIARRLPLSRYKVLGYLRAGVIQLEHVTNTDMLELAKLDRRRQQLRHRLGTMAAVEV